MLKAERIGLIGQSALCTFGNPQNIPGMDPETNKQLNVPRVNLFLMFFKFLLSVSSNELIYLYQSPIINLKLDLSFKIFSVLPT